MDPTSETRDALAIMQGLKERLVRREGVGADLPIIVLLLRDGVELLSFLVQQVHPGDYVTLVTRAISMTDCDQIVIANDAYGLFNSEEVVGLLQKTERRSLAQRFAAGDPDVVEVLVAFCYHVSGDVSVRVAKYRYEGRKIVWLEGEMSMKEDGEVSGAMRDSCVNGFGLQKARTGPPLTPQELADYLGVEVWWPALDARPPRNAPCPCGSGLKSKHCCWGPRSN